MHAYFRMILLLLWFPMLGLASGPAPDGLEAVQADLCFFTDASASTLAPELDVDRLNEFQSDALREVAAAMLNETYTPGLRLGQFEAVSSPRRLAQTLRLRPGFSRYEGITGLKLSEGDHVILMGPAGDATVTLRIPDWMRQPPEGVEPRKDPAGWGLKAQVFPLQEGVNRIQVQKAGLAYLHVVSDQPEQSAGVTVHFLSGEPNGLFDPAVHDNADWDRLLQGETHPILDMRGKYIQVAFPKIWLKTFAGGRGVELVNAFDRILEHHYTFMGLFKYDRVPRNRILARVNHNYYMFRDRDGVAYLGNRGTMRKVVDPESVVRGDSCWGFSHEAGHVLQMIPQLTWGGMTEVSCNLFTMYTLTELGNPSRLLQQGTYASARRKVVEADPRPSYLTTGVFERLVPFWQLHLYFSRQGRPDFYADVMEALRNRPSAGKGNDAIRNQFEFIKVVCDEAELDLIDFFEKWGFFWTGEIVVNDYGTYRYTITPDMVEDVRTYIASRGYPKPATDLTLLKDDT
jgi:hypothetical protein